MRPGLLVSSLPPRGRRGESIGDRTWQLQDRLQQRLHLGSDGASATATFDEAAEPANDVGAKVHDAKEKSARAVTSVKQSVHVRVHEDAVALRRRRKQLLAMTVAAVSTVVAATARRVAAQRTVATRSE